MTGPGAGKIPLKAKVTLIGPENLEVSAEVYLHVKGYSLARVTHLDIEFPGAESLIRGNGEFLTLIGIKDGFMIDFGNFRKFNKRKFKYLKLAAPELKDLLPAPERTRAFIGRKYGGIFIGFRKDYIKKLEDLARKLAPELF